MLPTHREMFQVLPVLLADPSECEYEISEDEMRLPGGSPEEKRKKSPYTHSRTYVRVHARPPSSHVCNQTQLCILETCDAVSSSTQPTTNRLKLNRRFFFLRTTVCVCVYARARTRVRVYARERTRAVACEHVCACERSLACVCVCDN